MIEQRKRAKINHKLKESTRLEESFINLKK